MMVPPAEVAAVPAPEILLVELHDVIGIDVGAPLAAYLSRLGSPESRRVMRSSLDTIARAVSGGTRDARSFPWPAVRYPHTAAIRAWLNERASPATASRDLCALRGILRECWRLGLLAGDDYRRAVDLAPIRGAALPRGRALDSGELRALFAACAANSASLEVPGTPACSPSSTAVDCAGRRPSPWTWPMSTRKAAPSPSAAARAAGPALPTFRQVAEPHSRSGSRSAAEIPGRCSIRSARAAATRPSSPAGSPPRPWPACSSGSPAQPGWRRRRAPTTCAAATSLTSSNSAPTSVPPSSSPATSHPPPPPATTAEASGPSSAPLSCSTSPTPAS